MATKLNGASAASVRSTSATLERDYRPIPAASRASGPFASVTSCRRPCPRHRPALGIAGYLPSTYAWEGAVLLGIGLALFNTMGNSVELDRDQSTISSRPRVPLKELKFELLP